MTLRLVLNPLLISGANWSYCRIRGIERIWKNIWKGWIFKNIDYYRKNCVTSSSFFTQVYFYYSIYFLTKIFF
jgi:hypothetical protein